MRLAPMMLLAACELPPSQLVEGAEPEPLRFALPLAEPARFPQVIGVDHDPVEHTDAVIPGSVCEDFAGRGFPHCYDQHDGSDFILQGGFSAMDAGSTLVLAAAAGVVTSVEASQYDRCHADLEAGEVSCDGHDKIANHVIVEHPDGTITKYWHLMTDSVLVEIGDEVGCGTPLGLVGSSGNSSMPHLHFEVELQDEVVIDPFVDEATAREPSWWLDQGPLHGLPSERCAD